MNLITGYFACSKVCWKRLVTSIFYFYRRVVSQFVTNIRNCWKESYRHCVEGCDCWICWCALKKIACLVWQTVVNIVCVVWRVVVVVVSFFLYPVYFALTIVRCIWLPCAICNSAPVINTCGDIRQNLRTSANEELTWYDKLFGAIFTPLKETGLSNAWDEYDFWLSVQGEVIHNAYSTDGLETIDLRLITMSVYEKDTFPEPAKCFFAQEDIESKYLRAEVFPHVLAFYSGPRPQAGNKVVVKGRLYWDRDGFLEIHPEHGGDLRIVP